MGKNAANIPLTDRREPYLRVFFLGFAAMLITMLPVMLVTGGYFIYYGDFNSQQIPFYWHAHEAVRNGAFGWDWQTDLGANFIGSYSFYLLGSPFFWLTYFCPQKFVPFMLPWLLALKHGTAALTAYAYIRRFVRSREAAMVGGLLYAFSGFQSFNIFFNHFQDVTAFFPLLLIAMEQRINENRRGVFALSAALLAVINYYFYTGQIVFAVLYFAVRCFSADFHADWRKFWSIALEGLIGTMLACFMLLPAALAILDNDRLRSWLLGLDMVAYSDRTRLWHIIQSFFMIPDAPARPNLFRTEYGKWSSIGGYLPMFSMAGVIAFMAQRRKHWATRLTGICIVCMFVPILNCMFYMLNGSYYARWYYMPVLIMAMMTAYALDNAEIKWKGGMISCAVMLGSFGLISLLPRKNSEKQVVWFDFAQYEWYFGITFGVCVILLYIALLLLLNRRRSKPFLKPAVWATVFSCMVSTASVVYFGIGLGTYPDAYVQYAIRGSEEISVDPPENPDNQFFRVDIAENYDNYPMFWGYSNMRCFHSIVPVSVMDFYQKQKITRDVASRIEQKNYPLRALFSVKYYFDHVDTDKAGEYSYQTEMPGFEYLNKQNGFYVYENKAFIPMGLAFGSYIPETELERLAPLAQQKLMLRAVGLNAEQIQKYSDILQVLPESERVSVSDAEYLELCEERKAQTCDVFRYDSYGFEAEITLEKPEMVFFSVPWEEGWSAEVNGQAVKAERVSYGFMAVRCEAGRNEIHFRYETPGLRAGVVTSTCGVAALVLYLLLAKLIGDAPAPKRKYFYDYISTVPMREIDLYIRHTARKR